MRLILDLVYAIALLLASPWLVYATWRDRGWRYLPARFGFVDDIPADAIWLHGSSVGEVSLLEPLIRQISSDFPQAPIVITSFTASGIAAARQRYGDHRVLPFPVDFSFVSGRIVRKRRPRAIVIVESDIWPNFVLAAEAAGVPVAIVNGKMSEGSFRWHQRIPILPRCLRAVRAVGAQSQAHAERFEALGIAPERIAVTGNVKYDLPLDERSLATRTRMRERYGLDDDDIVLIGASLHLPEDEAFLDMLTSLSPPCLSVRGVIVPRYPADGAVIADHARARGFEPLLKTVLSERVDRIEDRQVLIVDTLGELRDLYHASDIAFVGGSLYFRGANKGGHNMLEPAALGVPVLFGPHVFSFRETVAELLAADAAISVDDEAGLLEGFRRLLDSPDERAAYGARAQQVALAGRGATARSLELLTPLLARH